MTVINYFFKQKIKNNPLLLFIKKIKQSKLKKAKIEKHISLKKTHEPHFKQQEQLQLLEQRR
jgi:hypothetical protein